MYNLSRLLLAIAVLEVVFCIAVFTLVISPLPLLIPLAFIGLEKAMRGKPRWAYGTAQWADEHELRRIGMIGGSEGLAIGRMTRGEAVPLIPSLLSVFDSRVSARDACEIVIRKYIQLGMPIRGRGETVRLSRSVHTAVFGPTGAGKGTSFIVPWLLEANESAIVLDYKGENAMLTARHREKAFRHRIVLLDPFCAFTKQPDCFNPIDEINRDSPNTIDDCRDLAEQLVVRAGDEREPHWNDSAEAWICATIAAVVLHSEIDNRSLQTARDVLSNPDKIPQLIELLCQSGGMYARLGGQLAHFRDKELSSTLTTANRHLRFLDTPAVAANTCRSSFDPNALRKGRMTVYCILPPEHMNSQTALLRMWIGSLTRAVVRGGLQHG
jgi:type IV secretion system protein VirD4